MFLTDAQSQYVAEYCALLRAALAQEKDGEHVIDMDAVADAVGKDIEKPAFYYTEESQQKKFNCDACGAFNDILGRFCYCSNCGSRNDLHELQVDTLAKLRTHADDSGGYDAIVSDAVGAFDTFTSQYVKQLVQRIPLRSARKARLARMRFHNLRTVATELKAGFDIDILEGLSAEEVAFAELLFHRRHVYEHNGSVTDEKYMTDSGDISVRLGQTIHESQVSAHRLIGLVNKTAENLHRQFHDIFPPEAEPIARQNERKAWRAKRQTAPQAKKA